MYIDYFLYPFFHEPSPTKLLSGDSDKFGQIRASKGLGNIPYTFNQLSILIRLEQTALASVPTSFSRQQADRTCPYPPRHHLFTPLTSSTQPTAGEATPPGGHPYPYLDGHASSHADLERLTSPLEYQSLFAMVSHPGIPQPPETITPAIDRRHRRHRRVHGKWRACQAEMRDSDDMDRFQPLHFPLVQRECAPNLHSCTSYILSIKMIHSYHSYIPFTHAYHSSAPTTASRRPCSLIE